jgi:hypothetical protein
MTKYDEELIHGDQHEGSDNDEDNVQKDIEEKIKFNDQEMMEDIDPVVIEMLIEDLYNEIISFREKEKGKNVIFLDRLTRKDFDSFIKKIRVVDY